VPFRIGIIYDQDVDGGRAGGWTTTFYNGITALEDALGKAKDLAAALNQLAGEESPVVAYSANLIPASRIGETRTTGYQAGSGDETDDSDYPTTAIYVRMYDQGGRRTGVWLRGNPDILVKAAILDKAALVASAGWKKFAKLILDVGNLWQIRAQNPATVKKPNTLLDATTGTFTCPNHGIPLNAPTKVRVQGVKNFSYANKTWNLAAVPDVNTFIVKGWDPPAQPTDIPDAGYTLKLDPLQTQITKLIPQFATKRNVGRPPRLLAGKAKKKR
jgi:hypothetical protein